tara:strand:+ start:366 stop:1817 length:1452 start_codon:yes stop_codon:yes gene_type:complete
MNNFRAIYFPLSIFNQENLVSICFLLFFVVFTIATSVTFSLLMLCGLGFLVLGFKNTPLFLVTGIFFFQQTMVLWDVYFQGFRHIIPILYLLAMGVLYITKTKYRFQSNNRLLDTLVFLFGLYIIGSMLVAYLAGTPIVHISQHVRYWVHGAATYFFISRVRLTTTEIKNIVHYFMIISILVLVGYLYVYWYGDDGFNIGLLFDKKLDDVGRIRIIGDLRYSMFLIFLFVAMKINRLRPYNVLYLSFPLIVFVFFVHQTRAYLVALMCVLIILALFEKKKMLNIGRIILPLFLVISLSFISMKYFVPNIYEFGIERFSTLLLGFENIDTVRGRFVEILWATSLWFENNLALGIGLGSDLFYQTDILSDMTGSKVWGVHNNYLFILTSMGIIGLVLFIAVFLIFFSQVVKYRNNIPNPFMKTVFLVGALLILSRLILGMSTGIASGSPFVWMMFFVGLCISIIRLTISDKGKHTQLLIRDFQNT